MCTERAGIKDEVMEMKKENRRPLLCLDLEGTLISNAVSQIPRPGLYPFLERAAVLCDLMLYTSVSRQRVDSIRHLLIEEQVVPAWFADLPIIHPTDTVKYKNRCGRSHAFLLDDQAAVVAAGEEDWWVPIEEFSPPYSEQDCELVKTLEKIQSRLSQL
ncbi:NIF family HAD-type phosphatase [Marinobacter lipolyticus]|uniref:NIF family HAD-type phosphatase n=1 Tax=Marinobacter lipolyticus TaxID=209639 RepID=UPI003A90B020